VVAIGGDDRPRFFPPVGEQFGPGLTVPLVDLGDPHRHGRAKRDDEQAGGHVVGAWRRLRSGVGLDLGE
jgi:hypothetical protein